MRFVAGSLNGTYLKEIHEQALDETDSVKIAVAYASGSPQILQDCWKKNVKVTFWGRYDETGPSPLTGIDPHLLMRIDPLESCSDFDPPLIFSNDHKH
jgi:hypothetical protein